MALLNTFSIVQSFKKGLYFKLLGYKETRVEIYRLGLALLIHISNHPRNTVTPLTAMFGGNGKTHKHTLEKLVTAGLLKSTLVNRGSNLIGVTVKYKGYLITQAGKEVLKAFESELQSIIDKIEAKKGK